MQEVENSLQFKDCLRWQQCDGGSGEEQQVEADDENVWGFKVFEAWFGFSKNKDIHIAH